MVDGVRYTHPEYDEYLPVWEKCEDVIQGGTRVLHKKREKYLRPYHEELPAAYDARLYRTTLYNAPFRTVIGCRGLLQKKPAVVSVPPAVEPLLADITLSGMSMAIFLGEIIEEVLTVGRVGIWVNYPAASEAVTQADALLLNLRPSMHKIEADALINWGTKRIGNETVTSLIVFAEEVVVPKDEFCGEEETRYRVLDLIDVDGSPAYRVRVMKHDDEAKADITLEEYIPLMGGKPLPRIPFVCISPDCVGLDVDAPPFEDLVALSLSHYDLTSAYYQGCYYSGLPQIYVSGYEPPAGTKLMVSPSTAWCFPGLGTKTGVIEVGSQGFVALEKALDRLERQMVVTGTRALELQKAGGQESVQTAELHLSSENSVLAAMGKAISAGTTWALKIVTDWMGADSSKVSVTLPTRFFDEPMSAEQRTSVVKAWMNQAISDEVKYEILKAGGDIAPDVSFEEEQTAISKSTAPDLTPQPAVPTATEPPPITP